MADSINIVEDRVIVSIDETHVEVISVGKQGPAGAPGASGPKGDPGDPATNLVKSVAGKTGVVTLVKADVGLGSVDNTSDASKPVSVAQQTALDGKANFPLANGTVPVRDSSGVQSSLAYSFSADQNTLARRDGSARVAVGTPTNVEHATTKAYVDAANALKVDRILSTFRLYGTDAAGVTIGLTYATSANASTVPLRDPAGALNVASPTTATHAVTKAYVDARTLQGVGFPNGAVAANVGTIYVDTAVTNGASSWIKKSGTGNTGWIVLEGDTGWRNVTSLFSNFEVVSVNDYGIRWRRVGNVNYIEGSCQIKSLSTDVLTLDVAMQARGDATVIRFHGQGVITEVIDLKILGTAMYPVPSSAATVGRRGYFNSSYGVSANQSNTWPTTLPGTAA